MYNQSDLSKTFFDLVQMIYFYNLKGKLKMNKGFFQWSKPNKIFYEEIFYLSEGGE